MGGLARLASAVRDSGLKERPMLTVDYGNSLSDPNDIREPGRDPGSAAKIMIETFKDLKYNFINVGEGEIILGRGFLEKTSSPSPLSSNLRDATSKKPIFKDFVIIEAAGFRFLLTGVFPKNAPLLKEIFKKENIEILEPALALRGIMDSQKDRFDFIIVLSSQNGRDNEDLAEKIPGIDLIIGAGDYFKSMGTEKHGTLFASNLPKGQSVSRLVLSPKNKDKKFTDISAIRDMKSRMERIDSAVSLIKNSAIDYRVKRMRMANLAAQRDELEKELRSREKNLHDPGKNLFMQERIFLDAGIFEDQKTRRLLENLRKGQSGPKNAADPTPYGRR